MKAFLYWSGGKDSALVLHKAQQENVAIRALVTTMNSGFNRISMHGVRRELLEAQATSLGLPLYTVELPEMPGMQAYEEASRKMHQWLSAAGFTHAVFGDIFLEDLKAYRESLLAKDSFQCLFPLWQKDTKSLLRDFYEQSFKGITVCVNSTVLDKNFCGRLLDQSFANDLPATVDPCGENGEYHSFVFDAPNFSKPVAFEKGEIVFKEYKAPRTQQTSAENSKPSSDNDDCFANPQPAAGFFFQDLTINCAL